MKEQTESWEMEKQRAFRQFRDRRYDDALTSYGKTLELAKKIDPNGLQVALTLNDMAVVYVTKDSPKNASALYEQSAGILQALLEHDAFKPDVIIPYMEAMAGLGKIHKADGNLPAAEDSFSRGIDVGKRVKDAAASKLRELVYEYKSVLQAEGKAKEAKSLDDDVAALAEQEQLPDENNSAQEQANKYIQKAEAAWKAKDVQRADAAYAEAARYVTKVKDPAFRADVESKIATYLCFVNNLPGAESALKATLRDLKESQAGENKMLPFLMSFSGVEHQLGRDEAAKNAGLLALKIAQREYPGDTLPVRQAMGTVVAAAMGLGQFDEAVPLFEKSYAMGKRMYAVDSPEMITQTCQLANLYWMARRRPDAEKLMAAYIETAQKHPKSVVLVARLINDYASVIARVKLRDEAVMFSNSALDVLKHAPDGATETKRATAMIKQLQISGPLPKSS